MAGVALALAVLTPDAARAQLDWGSLERKEAPPPDLGPTSADAPLPPQGPYAAGEPEQEQPEVNQIEDPKQAPIDEDDEREPPDYDGVDEPTTAGEVALWVPRILLSPLYLVSEYVVRRPLGWLVTTAEREKLPAILVDFFTFGPDRQAGIIPTFLFDFGVRASVGLYFFWDEALAEPNEIRIRAATGGTDWWKLQVVDRVNLSADDRVYVSGGLEIRPDWTFYGMGPETDHGEDPRYRKDLYESELGYELDLARSSTFEAFVGIRDVSFDIGTGCCEDPTVAEELARPSPPFAAPPGLDGYTVLRHGMVASLDSRPERHAAELVEGSDFVSPAGSGVKLEIRGEHAGGLEQRAGGRYHWLKYGGTLGGFADVTGQQRTVGLQLIADFADPLRSGGEIPFTEQVTLGGDRPMRGFLEGALVDRSSVAARLSYTWPVWVWLDGSLNYTLGNVFGEHLSGFEPELLRSSFGLGLRSAGKRDHAFEMLVAAGTDPIRDGMAIDNVRFVLGATSGF